MSMGRFERVTATLVLTVSGFVAAGGAGPRGELATTRRQPVAMAAAEGGRWLFVADHASGTVSVVDPAARAVVAEIGVGRSLSDLVLTPDGRRALVVD